MLSTSLLNLGDVRANVTAMVDSAGVQLSGFDSTRPATAKLTSVTGSAVSVTILAANAARRQFLVVNESTKSLYLAFAATASTTAYTVHVASQNLYVSPLNTYTGIITGIWTAANGNARVTDITT